MVFSNRGFAVNVYINMPSHSGNLSILLPCTLSGT